MSIKIDSIITAQEIIEIEARKTSKIYIQRDEDGYALYLMFSNKEIVRYSLDFDEKECRILKESLPNMINSAQNYMLMVKKFEGFKGRFSYFFRSIGNFIWNPLKDYLQKLIYVFLIYITVLLLGVSRVIIFPHRGNQDSPPLSA
jgi:hypothetical protein